MRWRSLASPVSPTQATHPGRVASRDSDCRRDLHVACVVDRLNPAQDESSRFAHRARVGHGELNEFSSVGNNVLWRDDADHVCAYPLGLDAVCRNTVQRAWFLQTASSHLGGSIPSTNQVSGFGLSPQVHSTDSDSVSDDCRERPLARLRCFCFDRRASRGLGTGVGTSSLRFASKPRTRSTRTRLVVWIDSPLSSRSIVRFETPASWASSAWVRFCSSRC